MEVIQDRGCSTDLQYKGQAYRIKEAVQDKGRSTDLQYKCQTYRIKEAVQAGCYKSLSLPQQKSLGSLSGVSVSSWKCVSSLDFLTQACLQSLSSSVCLKHTVSVSSMQSLSRSLPQAVSMFHACSFRFNFRYAVSVSN